MTFVARDSGFVSRKLAREVGRGQPLPQDLEPYLEMLQRYNGLIMLLAWSLARAAPTQMQLEVRP